MKKSNVMIMEVTAENQSELLNQSKLLYGKVTVVAALTVMLLAASPFVLPHQQQSIAQEQQQQSLSNQTTLDIERPIEDLSFEINNMTFSHHTVLTTLSQIYS
jgi:hypothetical protein